MGTVTMEVTNQEITKHLIGTTTITNPILLLEVNGVPVSGSMVVQTAGVSKRHIFPIKEGNNIYLVSSSLVFGTELPALTISVKVRVAQ